VKASEDFERLYARHGPAVMAYALRRADPDLAQDVVAETFTVVWRRFDDCPSESLPWIYGIARNVIANQRRSQRRQVRVVARIVETLDLTPGGTGDAIREALAALDRRDRELLMLIAWEGLSPREAAAALGCSANAARIRLHRARRKLERELERDSRSVINPKAGEA
jgi:RNA polymerase sigma-70 factor (ECF subfamily)